MLLIGGFVMYVWRMMYVIVHVSLAAVLVVYNAKDYFNLTT